MYERVRKLIPRTTTTNTTNTTTFGFFDQLEITQLRLEPQNSSKEEPMRIADARLFTGQMPFLLPTNVSEHRRSCFQSQIVPSNMHHPVFGVAYCTGQSVTFTEKDVSGQAIIMTDGN